MSQARGLPRGDRTIHFIGDWHAGQTNTDRLEIVRRDLARRTIVTPALRVQVGDTTHGGTSAQDAQFISGMNALRPAVPWYAAIGNHDHQSSIRTSAAWAAVHGYPSQNYNIDLDWLRIIVIGPPSYRFNSALVDLDTAALDHLDAALAGTTKDCWIVCHAPLYNTVLTIPGASAGSTETDFHARPDASIRPILAARPNAKAWISGHTHSDPRSPGFVKAETVGSRTIAAINCSALQNVNPGDDRHDPLRTLFATRIDGAIEVRVRNHGAGVWDAIDGQRVTTITVGA